MADLFAETKDTAIRATVPARVRGRDTRLEHAPETGLFPGIDLPADNQVAGTVTDIRYSDAATGFSVLKIRQDDGTISTIRSASCSANLGERITARGRWTRHPRFGPQFDASSIMVSLPDTTQGLVRYLCDPLNPALKGIGRTTAERLARYFGASLPSVIADADALANSGVALAKCQKIAMHMRHRTDYASLLSFLFSHGLGPSAARRILDALGERAEAIIRADPYRLSTEVRGIGFLRADAIARSQSIRPDAPERLRAGILHVLNDAARSGHCALPRSSLISRSVDLMAVDASAVDLQVSSMMRAGTLAADAIDVRNLVYLTDIRDAEIEVADLLVARLGADPSFEGREEELLAAIAHAEASVMEATGRPMDPAQRDAVLLCLKERVSVVTGGPGTGKTTITRVLLGALEYLNRTRLDFSVALAAPTGRAASRLAEATSRPAKTVHRLLEWSAAGRHRGFQRSAQNPIEAKLLGIDEATMMDLFLLRDTLRALPEHTKLVLIADVDQLGSIGCGDVMRDLIESGRVPTARLRKIHRTRAGSGIALAASQIRQGRVPTFSAPSPDSDMWSVRVEEPEQTVQCVTRLVSGLLPSVFGYDPLNDIQIICPGHQNVAGTVNLNRALQNTLNPLCLDDPYINVPGGQFRIGDRVLQTANDKTRDLSNGDIGRIVSISRDRVGGTSKAVVSVEFRGRVVSYLPAELGQLSLAYAISCHKSQGSEFPVVLAVMTYQHRIMLTRPLIYTAVTRAREICCVIGQRQAIRTAILDPGELRITALARRIVDRAIARDYGVDAPLTRENGPPDTVTGHGVFRHGAAAGTGIDRLPLFAG